MRGNIGGRRGFTVNEVKYMVKNQKKIYEGSYRPHATVPVPPKAGDRWLLPQKNPVSFFIPPASLKLHQPGAQLLSKEAYFIKFVKHRPKSLSRRSIILSHTVF